MFWWNILQTGTLSIPSHLSSLIGLLSYDNESESKILLSESKTRLFIYKNNVKKQHVGCKSLYQIQFVSNSESLIVYCISIWSNILVRWAWGKDARSSLNLMLQHIQMPTYPQPWELPIQWAGPERIGNHINRRFRKTDKYQNRRLLMGQRPIKQC